MIDLHTHILPGIDDGAPDVHTALTMLRMQKQQGVDTVALTPHFYRTNEHVEEFLARRNASWKELCNHVDGVSFPKMILGAEVAWVPGMADWPELHSLCYESTKTLLIELPVSPWNDEMFRQLHNLVGRQGVTPMIAHLDRYLWSQKKQHIEQLLDIGFPVQVSGAAILHRVRRSWMFHLLKEHEALLISDCHNTDTRPPDMGEAMRFLEKKLGTQMAERVANATTKALLD